MKHMSPLNKSAQKTKMGKMKDATCFMVTLW